MVIVSIEVDMRDIRLGTKQHISLFVQVKDYRNLTRFKQGLAHGFRQKRMAEAIKRFMDVQANRHSPRKFSRLCSTMSLRQCGGLGLHQ